MKTGRSQHYVHVCKCSKLATILLNGLKSFLYFINVKVYRTKVAQGHLVDRR